MAEEDRPERFHLPLFDGSNFASWKFRMQVLLEEYELLECVETEMEEVAALQDATGDSAEVKQRKEKEREKWKKKERKCKSMIISRIHDSQLEFVQGKRTPKEIWTALGRVFERHSIASRMHLKRKMLALRYEGGPLQEHFLCFDRLVREYRGTGAEMEELDVICHLLLTLGPSFDTVVTALETMPEANLNMEFVKCRLLDEETKRKVMHGEPIVKNESAVFLGAKQPKKFRCFGCKQEGHKLADCPLKKVTKSGEKSHEKHSPKAHVAESGPKNVCFAAASGDVIKKKFSEEFRVQWFIDSGCSDHIVNDETLFEDLKPLKCPVEIAVAKHGESIVAKHSGTIRVVSNVNGTEVECTVKDVLFVPESRCNLFSVMRVDDAGMSVTYENGRVVVCRGSEAVAMGSRCGKLYRLDLYTTKRSASGSMLTCGRIPKSLELWHRRFGHLNARGLEKLISGSMVTGLEVTGGKSDKSVVMCEPCVIGKQTRKPFPERSEKRSSRVLELIHSDVCGPVSPDGVGGVHYFVTFIDDWSHFTMTFLMERKSEVFGLFQQYEALVTAKFGVHISRLRCDNGGEYRSSQFEEFCRRKGIQVEWTVPHTPEQNGVSERMNRTLVERTRSMLEDSGLDKRFWAPAIQTATYLVNRSPTSAIGDGVTPYEMWEGRKPDVTKLRSFGCAAYVHVPKELRKKLDPKAWKGAFVGYAHNGYRIWNPVSKRIVHARDVDFNEAESGKATVTKTRSFDTFVPSPTVYEESDSGVEEDEVTDPGAESDHYSTDSEEEAVTEHSEEEYRSCEDEDGPETDTGSHADTGQHPDVYNGSGRPHRTRHPPSWHQEYEVEYINTARAYAFGATHRHRAMSAW